VDSRRPTISAVAERRARQRRTGSLGIRNASLLRALIRMTQSGRFGPYVTPQTFELADGSGALASGQREYEDGPRFFSHFEEALRPESLAGRRVLDLGCGYGGRTVYYAKDCGAAEVVGIEISATMVDRGERFAASMNVANVTFDVGAGEALPYAEQTFDIVIAFDVLEHVRDPRLVLGEIARVLRPGGSGWLVFPTYLGARASHLDYLTQIPLLHRVFDPDTIIDVVNEFLRADHDRYGVAPQPRPQEGAFGRITLPTLNGMTMRESRDLATASGLTIVEMRPTPIITRHVPLPGAPLAARVLQGWIKRGNIPELLIGHVAMHLRQGGASTGETCLSGRHERTGR
jgi:SAM-dependent methyltransferase